MSKIIYTKYSNERARRFAIRTDIMEDHGRRFVFKQALWPQGQCHVRNIEQWYQQLNQRYGNTRISMNRCGIQEEGLMLEYLEEGTLEQELDACLMEGRLEELEEKLFDYLEEVKKGFWLDHFDKSPEFEKVFGKVDVPEDLISGDVVDVDMVLNNVVLEQGFTLIDYEWTFDFPIPYEYVVYRILVYYLRGNSARNCLQALNLYEKAGLTPEKMELYEKMERHFQDIYVVSEEEEGQYHIPIRDLYDEITPGVVDLRDLRLKDQSEQEAKKVQLYQSPDLAFSEERSERKSPEKEGVFLDYFPVEPDCVYVRLDPCSKYCRVRNLQMQWGEDVMNYQTNGIPQEDGSLLFAVDDPQIIVKRWENAMGDFRVYFEVEYFTQEEIVQILRRGYGMLRKECKELRSEQELLTQKLSEREAKISAMENTRVWKAYRKIKGN